MECLQKNTVLCIKEDKIDPLIEPDPIRRRRKQKENHLDEWFPFWQVAPKKISANNTNIIFRSLQL